jgi:hypothetical protein
MSVTLNSITPPSSGVWRGTTRSSMWRRAGGSCALSMASAAFFSRFSTTCSIRIGSTMIGQALRHVGVDGHVAPAQLDAGQVHRVLDDLPGLRRLALRLAALHEGADAVDDLPGALGLAGGLLQRGDQVVLDDGVGLHARHHAVAVVGDGRQRLVQLVRHRAGHLAHRHQPAVTWAFSACAAACSSARSGR